MARIAGRISLLAAFAAALAAAPGPALSPEPALAQEGMWTAVGDPAADTAAAADSSRARTGALAAERPPAKPPVDWVDVVTFPVEVVTFPLDLLSEGIQAGLTLASGTRAPGPVLTAYRDLRAWGLKPGAGSAGPRGGPAGRLHLDRLAPLHLSSTYSLRGSQRHEAWVQLPRGTNRAVVRGWFRRYAEPYFWGVGTDDPETAAVDYLWDQWGGEVSARPLRGELLRVRVGAGYENNRIADGHDEATPDLSTRFAPGDLFGFGDRTEFLRVGGSVTLDLARRGLFQNRGVELELRGRYFRGVGGTGADFHRLGARLAGFLPVNSRQSLVVRGRAETNVADEGRGVPFTHLAALGDAVGGRAYTDDRFRGDELAAGAVEWHWELWREVRERARLEAMLFFEEGVTARDLSAVDSSDWRPGYGFGMRFMTPDGPVAQWYLSHGEEGTRFQLGVGVEP